MIKKKIKKNNGFSFVYKAVKNPYPLLILVLLLSLILLGNRNIGVYLALCLVISSYVLLCSRIEKKLLDFSLFGPFTLSSFFNCLGSGIGLLMHVIGSQKLGFPVSPEILTIQLAFVIGFPFQILGYWIYFKKLKIHSGVLNARLTLLDRKKIVKVTWFFLAFVILQSIVSIATGAWDRSQINFSSLSSGAFSSAAAIFTVFTAFPYLCYLLLPFTLKNIKLTSKLSVYLFLFVLILAWASTGSRGLILYFFVYFLLGCLIFKTISAQKAKIYLVSVILIGIVLIPALDRFRNSQQFAQATNVLDRIEILAESIFSEGDFDQGSFLRLTGDALYGKMNDINIYRKTPDVIPHAGWDNFEAILYVFLPKSFFPNKPSIFDGHEIALAYMSSYGGGFATISFNADLYRRFGWPGIIIGNFVFGIFYGFVALTVFQKFLTKSSIFNFLIILILYAFYIPTGTVLTTFWIWFYNFPKYIIAIYCICLLVKGFSAPPLSLLEGRNSAAVR